MNELALFAGAGGGILGAKLLGWRTVCAVEFDPYCRRVLMQRQNDGMLDPFPIWDDMRTFDGKPWRGKVDVVTAGFPCQPFSVAGKREGERDTRNLWPDTLRVLCEIRPPFALLENVPALISCGYIGTVLRGLAESGFSGRWGCLPACAVGTRFIRDRLWIVATAGAVDGTNGQHSGNVERLTPTVVRWMQDDSIRPSDGGAPWAREPELARVAYGIPYRVDRLKALGNGQVPAVVRAAWELLGPTNG